MGLLSAEAGDVAQGRFLGCLSGVTSGLSAFLRGRVIPSPLAAGPLKQTAY